MPNNDASVTELLTYNHNPVGSIFNVDVNWTHVIIHVNDHDSTGLNAPLHNIINAWANNHYVAGAFALDIATWFIGVAACVYLFFFAGRSGVKHYFGLRIALLLFTISRFFSWLYQVIANTQPLTRGYTLFWMVPSGFSIATDVMFVYVLARTICQPLVVATGYKRSRGIGLGFSLSYALVATADWLFTLVLQGIHSGYNWGRDYFGERTATGSFLTGCIVAALGLLWGFVYFGLAVRATRQTKGRISDSLRVVPKLMMGAATLWTLRAGINAVNAFGIWDAISSGSIYAITPLIQALVVDIGGLALFGLFFASHRQSMESLYEGYYAAMPSEAELGESYGEHKVSVDAHTKA